MRAPHQPQVGSTQRHNMWSFADGGRHRAGSLLEEHDPKGPSGPFPFVAFQGAESLFRGSPHRCHLTLTGQQRSAKQFVHVHCPGTFSLDPQKKDTVQFDGDTKSFQRQCVIHNLPSHHGLHVHTLIPATWPRATCLPLLTTCV